MAVPVPGIVVNGRSSPTLERHHSVVSIMVNEQHGVRLQYLLVAALGLGDA